MTDQRSSEAQTSQTASPGAGSEPTERCPECHGAVVADGGGGETVCTDCGLVLSEQPIDLGPEWYAFDTETYNQQSRVGAPITQLLHDKGLSTVMGWEDTDAYDRVVNPETRRRLARLRTWDERFRVRNWRERNLAHALGEINRMAAALGVPGPTRETAGVIYRQALTRGLLPGRSIEGIASAALYAASRLDGVARSTTEVSSVSRVGEIELMRAYRYLARELDLQIPPPDPVEYLGRIASKLGCTKETERRARDLLDTATDDGVHSGRNPVGIAASAVYAAGVLTGEQLTQQAVAEAAGVGKVTIRHRYRELLAAAERAAGEDPA
jgi:transcription initiation factor TFIIB